MQEYKQLELVNVSDTPEKITFIFLDEEKGEIHNVVWRKQKLNTQTQQYEDDERKLDLVKKWAKDYFDLEIDELEKAVGTRKDIYAYDTYDSLWKVDKRFDPSKDVNKMIKTKIKSIDLNEEGITIHYDWQGDTYSSNMKFTEQFNGKYYPNPQKRARQIRKFEDTYGVPIEDKDKLIGEDIMVKVKKIGKYAYGEITYLRED